LSAATSTPAHRLERCYGHVYLKSQLLHVLQYTNCSAQSPQECATQILAYGYGIDAGAITDIDYSAAQAVRDLLDELDCQGVGMVFARVGSYLRSDMDRLSITAAIGETQIFSTLHEAIAAVRFGALSSRVDGPHSNV
jgi:STAS domain-containing protein